MNGVIIVSTCRKQTPELDFAAMTLALHGQYQFRKGQFVEIIIFPHSSSFFGILRKLFWTLGTFSLPKKTYFI
jgi:hypothetical protein